MGSLPLTLAIPMMLLAQEEPSVAASASHDIVLLLASRDKGAADVRPLLDAVATYTRDLGVRVQLVLVEEEVLRAGGRESAGVILRARAARLAFWCVRPGTDAHSLSLFVLDSEGVLHKDSISGGAAARGGAGRDLHRVGALKLRAMLAAEPAREPPVSEGGTGPGRTTVEQGAPSAAVPAPGTSAATTPGVPAGTKPRLPPASTAVPPAQRTAADPPPVSDSRAPTSATGGQAPLRGDRGAEYSAETAATAPPAAASPSPSPRAPSLSWRGVIFSAAYSLSIAPGDSSLRQGATFHGTLGLSPPVEIGASLDWIAPSQRTVPAGTIALRDIPLRMGARLVQRGRRVLAGAGAFGAVHVLSATASSVNGRQDSSTAAAGVGFEAIARGAVGGSLSWEVRAWAERLIPRTRFLVGGTPAVETGAVTLGLALGLAFPTH